jgi:hypothetical protein
VQAYGAHGLIGLTGEQWKAVGNGGACGERRRRGKHRCSASETGAPGRNPVQELHDVEGLLLALLDGTEAAQWWLAMPSRGGSMSKEQSGAGSESSTRRRQSGEGLVHCGVRMRIRSCPCGAVAKWWALQTGGNRSATGWWCPNGAGARRSKGVGVLTSGADPVLTFLKKIQTLPNFEMQTRCLPLFQNNQTLHDARFEQDE